MDLRGVMVVEDDGGVEPSGGSGRLGAMQHVANRPIAHHVLDALEAAGATEVVVVVPKDRAEQVRAALDARDRPGAAHLSYVSGPGAIHLGGALTLAGPLIDRHPCVVHVASGLLGEPLNPLMQGWSFDRPDVQLILHQSPSPDERLSTANMAMLKVAELDPSRAALGMAGVWLFGAGSLRRIGDLPPGPTGRIDMARVSARLQAAGGALGIRLAEGWHRFAGDPLDLLEMNRLVLDRLPVGPRPTVGDGTQIEGRVRIDEGAVVESSVIVGPAIIGPNARIVDAYIGPYTSIGAGAHIEGAEIERSIIFARASIVHVGGRLVSSLVGEDARIFRDFSLPRALRLRVGDGTEIALC